MEEYKVTITISEYTELVRFKRDLQILEAAVRKSLKYNQYLDRPTITDDLVLPVLKALAPAQYETIEEMLKEEYERTTKEKNG